MSVKSLDRLLPRRYILRYADRSIVKGDDGKAISFATKTAAKLFRKSVSIDLVVSPGPDHRKW